LHLAVGAGLCARTEQALPPVSEGDEQKLPYRRDVYKGEGEDKYLYRRFCSFSLPIYFWPCLSLQAGGFAIATEGSRRDRNKELVRRMHAGVWSEPDKEKAAKAM
jgi:hypothetical protein